MKVGEDLIHLVLFSCFCTMMSRYRDNNGYFDYIYLGLFSTIEGYPLLWTFPMKRIMRHRYISIQFLQMLGFLLFLYSYLLWD